MISPICRFERAHFSANVSMRSAFVKGAYLASVWSTGIRKRQPASSAGPPSPGRKGRENRTVVERARRMPDSLVTAAALLGASLKGRERVTLQIVGDGAIGRIVADVVTSDDHGIGARAFAQNPSADVPLNARGKFDVAKLVGSGQLQVTRSFEVGQPYSGVVPLVSGEIAEDLAS